MCWDGCRLFVSSGSVGLWVNLFFWEAYGHHDIQPETGRKWLGFGLG